MPKNKRPAPRKSATSPEVIDEQNALILSQLALDLSEREEYHAEDEILRQKDLDFKRLLRKLLNQHKDEVLYSAIELAQDEAIEAWTLLREAVAEEAGTLLLRREGAPTLEVNAFAIPLFVHSTGGLDALQDFQDPEAFDALVASFQQAGLEGPKAKVVLIRHAYDLKEIDGITYGALHAMVRDAATSMTEKKLVQTPALERSMSGWAPSAFGASDSAVELRFLLGFALKREDDPFYQVPTDEAAADAWFAARMARYQAWTEQYAPLVRRCLSATPDALSLNFLYQDLFFGAKEQALAEYATLQMLADLNHALEAAQLDPAQASVVLAPADIDGQMVLRVQLSAAPGTAVLAICDRPLDLAADLELEVDDVRDALASIGILRVAVAQKFDASGQPYDPRPLSIPV
ncbi:MAG: hypothetical protein ACEQSK_07510 [Sphingomonadaceae bacterium]